MSGPVTERAKRIKRIRDVRRDWLSPLIWRNHTTASHEFQLLDVLRDIRLVLTLILLVVTLGYCHERPGISVHLLDKTEAA